MRAVVFVSKCELVLFPWFPSILIPALANDVLGSQCVLMLYACCLQGSRPSQKAANSAFEGPSGADVCFAF